ncbi:MAG: hypothetical protein DCC75_07310, partial [Proteobacteria bacterium]
TIQVQGGSYEDAVDLGFDLEDLTILGGYNQDFSARDPANNPSIINYFRLNVFHSGQVTLDGFTVMNSTSQGVSVSSALSSLMLRNCRIYNNASYGVYAYHVDNITVEDCIIHSNGTYGGIGIGSHSLAGQAIVRNNIVYNHSCGSCYGIHLTNADGDERIEGNTVYSNSGGIFMGALSGTSPLVNDNLVYENGDGIYAWYGSTFVTENLSVRNTGDGIKYSSPESPVIANNTIADNSSIGLQIFGPSGTPNISNNIVSGNGSHGIFISRNANSFGNTAIVPSAFRYNIIYLNGSSPFLHVSLPPAYSYSSEVPGEFGDMNGFAWSEGNIKVAPNFNLSDSLDYTLATGSFAIDEGDPNSDYTSEPNQNGGRINIGYDGGTSQAQVSPPQPNISGLALEFDGEDLTMSFDTSTGTSHYWITAEYWDGDQFQDIPAASLSGDYYLVGYKAGRIESGLARQLLWDNAGSVLGSLSSPTIIRLNIEHGTQSHTIQSSPLITSTLTPTPTSTPLPEPTATPTPAASATATALPSATSTPAPTEIATPLPTSGPQEPDAHPPLISEITAASSRNTVNSLTFMLSDPDSSKVTVRLTITYGRRGVIKLVKTVRGVGAAPKRFSFDLKRYKLRASRCEFRLRATDPDNNSHALRRR